MIRKLKFSLIICSVWAFSAEAWVPPEIETEYTHAVLSYQTGQYPETLAKIDGLLKSFPDQIEFLELRALALKQSNRTTESIRAYEKLVALQAGASRGAAPYHFELGVLLFYEQHPDKALAHFVQALDAGFNKALCHYYLGMIDQAAGRMKFAVQHFEEMIFNGERELIPAAYFQLAWIRLKQGDAATCIRYLSAAQSASAGLLEKSELPSSSRALMTQIRDAAEKNLAPFDRDRYFGSVGLLLGYNSNTAYMPTAITDSKTLEAKDSPAALLYGGAGWMSSPLKRWQWIPMYRGNMDYNTNSKTRTNEYHQHTLSLQVINGPLLPLSWGVRGGAGLTLRNTVPSDASLTKYTLKRYNHHFFIAPTVRREIKPGFQVGGEMMLQSTSYAFDGKGVAKKSGTSFQLLPFATLRTDHSLLQPQGKLKYEHYFAGKNFSFDAFGVEAANHMKLPYETDLQTSLGWTHTEFTKRVDGLRFDNLWNLMLHATRPLKVLSPRMIAVVSLQFTKNTSSLPDSFSYNQFILMAGAEYRF